MSVSYTNRKSRTYYLCRGVTKTGKPRYYFSLEPKGNMPEELPEGYEIRESVNGVVSLAKIRPMQLSGEEIDAVRVKLSKHPKARDYRVDINPTQITIYERVGPDIEELAACIAETLGIKTFMAGEIIQKMQEEERIRVQFTPIMRFILADTERRHFNAQRMCYLGSIDDWIDIEYKKPLPGLVSKLIPLLGTEEFFTLI